MVTRLRFQMRVKGNLPEAWSDWFGDVSIDNTPTGASDISGTLKDQAEMIGLLNGMHDLGLRILWLSWSLSSVEESWKLT